MPSKRTAKQRKTKPTDPYPHAYICKACAVSKGGKWPKGHLATQHCDTCPYCKKEAGLCAVDDWIMPGRKLSLSTWD
jgi:hypothetical protein